MSLYAIYIEITKAEPLIQQPFCDTRRVCLRGRPESPHEIRAESARKWNASPALVKQRKL